MKDVKKKHLWKDHSTSKGIPAAPHEAQHGYYPYVLGSIFFVALLLRSLCLFELIDTHLLYTLMGDSELYDIWAGEILESQWIGTKVFFQAPFYPYFLAVVYRFIGHDLLLVRLIQIFIGSASCLLIAETGRYFFSRKAGILAGFLMAVYPTAIFYDLLIQKAVFGLFFTALILFLLGRTTVSTKWIYWPATGFILGCLVMVRENALILFPVIFLWLVVYHRQSNVRKIVLWGTLFACGLALVMFPVALRNKIVGGEFILTTYNLGFNLYIGNSGDATGTYRSLVRGQGDWRYESDDAKRLAEKALGRTLSHAEVSRYWTRMALEEIRGDFMQWVRLLLRKWALVWNAVEASDTESIYAYRYFSAILRILGYIMHFGVLLPMAAAGVCLTWNVRSRLWLLYLFLLAYAAGIMPFFVFARYRQTMLAILVPFAAAGLLISWRYFREKNYQPVVIALVFAGLTAVFSNLTIFPKATVTAHTYYNWGSIFENQDKLRDAKRYYSRAIELNPQHTLAYHNLGVINCREGDYSEGIKQFKQVLQIQPGIAKTHENLGMARYYTGDLNGALKSFKKVLEIDPDYGPQVNYNIACVLARQNKIDPSLEMLRRAVRGGYANRDQLESDPDLENIRSTPEFKAIMETMGEGG
ncbi:tetratricopeptide repeat protein [Thermodesulfobacteriota bacterium]